MVNDFVNPNDVWCSRLRQYPNYSKTEPPPALAEHFTPDVFAKSQAYGRDKARFSMFSGVFSQILETAILYYGGYAWAWEFAGKVLSYYGYGPEYQVRTIFSWISLLWQSMFWCVTPNLEIPQSIVFSTLLFAMSSIPSLPMDLYKTFVLEEKHGFNKTTPMLFFTDLLKGWLVAFLIGAPFLSAFLWVVRWAEDRFVPWLMGFL